MLWLIHLRTYDYPTVTVKEGYTFLGWIGDTYETMPAHDVTYTANIDNAINKLTDRKSVV